MFTNILLYQLIESPYIGTVKHLALPCVLASSVEILETMDPVGTVRPQVGPQHVTDGRLKPSQSHLLKTCFVLKLTMLNSGYVWNGFLFF